MYIFATCSNLSSNENTFLIFFVLFYILFSLQIPLLVIKGNLGKMKHSKMSIATYCSIPPHNKNYNATLWVDMSESRRTATPVHTWL